MKKDNDYNGLANDAFNDDELLNGLKSLESTWNAVDVKDPVVELPDGEYNAYVSDIYMTVTKYGNPAISWKLTITDDETYNGKIVNKMSVLKTESQVKFAKQDLKNAGLDVPVITELPKIVGTLRNAKLRIKQTTNGKYKNIYILERLDEPKNVFEDQFDENLNDDEDL